MSRAFMENLDYLGVILDSEGYHTWGTSAVQGDDGQFHLYACQWPVEVGFQNWHRESMVNYYVAPKPEGPYTFVKTIVGPRPGGDKEGVWNRYTAHNPEVKKIDGRYVLIYISYPKVRQTHNQRIGMKIAEHPAGPWRDVGENGLVLEKSRVEGDLTFGSERGTTNPSLVKYRDKYYLFFTYKPRGHHKHLGVAVSDALAGPYKVQQTPAFSPPKGKKVEDPSVFVNGDKLAALLCDNFGIVARDGGVYCEMDQAHFDQTGEVRMTLKSLAWDTRPRMFPDQDFSKGKGIYVLNKFERPKVIDVNDEPAYLFLSSGFNAKGDNRTTLHGFRFKKPLSKLMTSPSE